MVRRQWLLVGALLLVAVAGVTATAVVQLDVEPAVQSVMQLHYPPLPSIDPALTPAAQDLSSAAASRIRREVMEALNAPALGKRVQATIVVAHPGGRPLVDMFGDRPAVSASSLKLVTAMAVLDAFDSSTTFHTDVVEGERTGELVLVGGGDATLASSDRPRGQTSVDPSLAELAERTSRRLAGIRSTVRLSYDATLFRGPAVSPAWEDDYVATGVVAPISPLMADQGRVSPTGSARFPDPAAAAANEFVQQLERNDIKVIGRPRPTDAHRAAAVIATVKSAPVPELVERMLRESDNELAESLGRLVAIEMGRPATFEGAVRSLAAAARFRGVPLDRERLHDASGLARTDQVTTETLVGVLQAAVESEALRAILSGLPVAGLDGTLADRFGNRDVAAASGRVRAKTGTLTGVSVEAGTALTCDGSFSVFAFIVDRVVGDTDAARRALDRAAAALTRCHRFG